MRLHPSADVVGLSPCGSGSLTRAPTYPDDLRTSHILSSRLGAGRSPGVVRGPDPVGPGSGRCHPAAAFRQVLRSLCLGDLGPGRLLPGVPTAPTMRPNGRRGRRTSEMVRIAKERIDDLFALAEEEAFEHRSYLPDRYVELARKVGMRYNVRLLPEYAELYCRGCSSFWVEGRTVRTRLRGGRRVRTCLVCGRLRRVPTRRRAGEHERSWGERIPPPVEEGALTDPVAEPYARTFKEPGTEDE